MTYQLTRLENVLTLCDSGEWGTDPTGTNGIPVIRVADIKANGVIRYDSAPLRSIPIPKIQGKTLKNRDVLVVKSSGSGTNVISGRAAIVEGLKDTDFGFANFLLRLRVDESVYDAKYLFYVLQSKPTRDQVLQIVGATTYPNLSVPKYRQIQIPLIPLPEQQRLVRILDEADALRQLRARAEARTNDFIPALFNEMFGDPATNPKGWKKVTLGEIGGQGQYGLNAAAMSEGTGVRYVRITDIDSQGRLEGAEPAFVPTDIENLDKYELREGDILIARSGATAGKSYLHLESPFRAVYAGYLIRFQIDSKQALPSFVARFLQTPHYWSQLNSLKRAVAQPNVNAKQLASIRFPLPPLALQREFAARVAEVRALQAQQARSRQRLEDLFQALLHRAFAGEL